MTSLTMEISLATEGDAVPIGMRQKSAIQWGGVLMLRSSRSLVFPDVVAMFDYGLSLVLGSVVFKSSLKVRFGVKGGLTMSKVLHLRNLREATQHQTTRHWIRGYSRNGLLGQY